MIFTIYSIHYTVHYRAFVKPIDLQNICNVLSIKKGIQRSGPHSCGVCGKYRVLEILSFRESWPSCGACPALASALIRLTVPAHVEVLKRPWAAAPQVPPSWDKANYSLLEHHGPLPRWKNNQASVSQPRSEHHKGAKNDVQLPTCRAHTGLGLEVCDKVCLKMSWNCVYSKSPTIGWTTGSFFLLIDFTNKSVSAM